MIFDNIIGIKSMKFKRLSIKVIKDSSTRQQCIQVQVRKDKHFAKLINFEQLMIPPNILNAYNVERLQEQIIFRQKIGSEDSEMTSNMENSHLNKFESFFAEDDHGQNRKQVQTDQVLSKLFCSIWVFWLEGFNRLNEEQICKRIKIFGCKKPLAVKYFAIDEEQFQQGSFLAYLKIQSEDQVQRTKQCLRHINEFFQPQNIYFPMQDFVNLNSIPSIHSYRCLNLIAQKYGKKIKQLADNNGILIEQIQPNYDQIQDQFRRKKIPIYSLCLKKIQGNRNSIHQLYFQIQKFLSGIDCKVIQLKPDLVIPQKLDKINVIFPQIYQNVHIISLNTLALINVKRDLKQIEKQMYLETWKIENQLFSPSDLRKLRMEHENRTLIQQLTQKGIFLQERLKFQDQTNFIEIICDKKTKEDFQKECRKIISQYVKREQDCYGYEDRLVIGTFTKYFKKQIQDKYDAKFKVHILGESKSRMTVTCYTKQEEKIREQLNSVNKKIQQSIISFVLRKNINSDLAAEKFLKNNEVYREIKNPEGYYENEKPAIGSNLYKMTENKSLINILYKPFEHLKLQKQEQIFVYLIGDSMSQNSHFHEIIKRNSINFQNFMTGAHATKKPERLIQYHTPNCEYSKAMILLHSGQRKVSQTLRRDMQKLLELLEKKEYEVMQEINLVIPYHQDRQFISEIFPVMLEEISNCKHKIIEESHLEQIKEKCVFTIYIYYEGISQNIERGFLRNQSESLKMIKTQLEMAMKKSQIKIKASKPLCLTQNDLIKIYCLNYVQMRYRSVPQKIYQASAAIAFITKMQLNRESNTPPRFIFSLPELGEQRNIDESLMSDLSTINRRKKVQYHVEIVFCIPLRKCYIITPNFYSSHQIGEEEDFTKMLTLESKNWTPPSIVSKTFDQMDSTAIQILYLITKYLPNITHLVLSAKEITDGQHSKRVEYSQRYYMVEKNKSEMKKVKLLLNKLKDEQKIQSEATDEYVKYKINDRYTEQWFEVKACNQLVEDICGCRQK